MRPISPGLAGSPLVAGFGSRTASAEPRLQPPLGRRPPPCVGKGAWPGGCGVPDSHPGSVGQGGFLRGSAAGSQ